MFFLPVSVSDQPQARSLKGPLARYGFGTQLPFNLRGLVAGDVAFLLGKMELRDPIDSNGESLLMVKLHLLFS